MTVATSFPGRLSDALRRLLMRQATIVASEPIGRDFQLLTFEGADLVDVDWMPGQKIQVAMAAPFVTRTYTPIDWDAVAGRTRILVFCHGDGPGSRWALDARVGDACDLFGPRSSLDATRVKGRLLLIGDETALGLAHALQAQDRLRPFSSLFEVDAPDQSQSCLTRLTIANAALYRRQGDDRHLDEIERIATGTEASYILAGRAKTIQRLRRTLKQQGVPPPRILTKAYWADGKTGLD